MRKLPVPAFIFTISCLLCPWISLSAQDGPRINEFLAVNDTGLDDADRGEEDWIELYNAEAETVNLEGWCLTDKADDLTKWRFPSILLPTNAYLVVFASQKDRREPGSELHTNFKLSSEGEYLALVHPDGYTVASQFAPAYPIQVPDVSYGLAEGRLEPFLSYFPLPTPGKANQGGLLRLGPAISGVSHVPVMPGASDDLLISARIDRTFDPVDSAELHYRIDFDPEITIPLPHANRVNATEYGAIIPSSALSAGQMVRWYITAKDSMNRETRYPRFADPANSPQYCGTVVEDPGLTNPLPVFYWFIQNPTAANSDTGTRCSLFYDGEFYDNVLINLHGQSSRGFPKKSYDIDFHPGHNFKWEQDAPRADDINLMTTYPDKALMRNILAYDTYREAGCPYHWVFPVRVQQNGVFWGTAHVMENGDEDWLIRMGINADGALYKMYNTFTSASDATSGAEKKTRVYENNADLQALRTGLSLSGDAKHQYLYDHVDIAQVVNFLAAMTLTGDVDCCHKNYYLYRDTGISDEWQMWPWDVDLSFGRRWISSMTYWDQTLIFNTPLFVGNNNGLPQAIFATPEMRQMYLRRLRTLMDDLLKPPGTPDKDLYYEPRMDELGLQIAPDAALDAAKWNSHAWGNGSTAPCCPQSLWEAVNEMRYEYFPERRHQLYDGLASGAREIPEAQPVDATIDFGMLELSPAIDNPDEEYIQLQNPNEYAVDISGWTLSGHANFTFRGGTVLPARTFLYVTASRPAFRKRTVYPRGGYALFVVGDYARSQTLDMNTLTLTNRHNETVARIDDIESYVPPEFTGTTQPGR
ncbi:MAG: CotH kinase family protein [Phycisphaerae bacterium]|nr:CotH kinase family protein [Phycisphaerae bacterium]